MCVLYHAMYTYARHDRIFEMKAAFHPTTKVVGFPPKLRPFLCHKIYGEDMAARKLESTV